MKIDGNKVTFEVDDKTIREYTGRNLISFDGKYIKEYTGRILYVYENNTIKEYTGRCIYKLDGYPTHNELMALFTILFARRW